jgi:hypothetical protein
MLIVTYNFHGGQSAVVLLIVSAVTLPIVSAIAVLIAVAVILLVVGTVVFLSFLSSSILRRPSGKRKNA